MKKKKTWKDMQREINLRDMIYDLYQKICYFWKFFDKIDEIDEFDNIRDYEKYKIYRESVSSNYIANESFKILKKYMIKKSNKVIYGYDVISNIEIGKVKVVFVNWTFIKRIKGKYFSILTSKENKYNNIKIVILKKGSENYNKIKRYGGIIKLKKLK